MIFSIIIVQFDLEIQKKDFISTEDGPVFTSAEYFNLLY